MSYLFKFIRSYIHLSTISRIDRILDNRFLNYLYRKFLKQCIKIIEQRALSLRILYIENTNACNARCIMCPREKMTREIGFMDLNLYKKIIDESIVLGVKEVHLQNFGEPLLDSLFLERIAYARKSGIKTVVFTNASLLQDKISEGILHAGLDEIIVSVDTSQKINYEKIRRGLDYEKTVENIKAFRKIRLKFGVKRPKIICVLTRTIQGKEEIEEARCFWQSIADQVIEKQAHDWAGAKNYFFRKYSFRHFWPCVFLWKSATILWDGQVTICCQDFDGKINLGNLKNDTLKNILSSEQIKHYREFHKKGKREELSLCNACQLNLLWAI